MEIAREGKGEGEGESCFFATPICHDHYTGDMTRKAATHDGRVPDTLWVGKSVGELRCSGELRYLVT